MIFIGLKRAIFFFRSLPSANMSPNWDFAWFEHICQTENLKHGADTVFWRCRVNREVNARKYMNEININNNRQQ